MGSGVALGSGAGAVALGVVEGPLAVTTGTGLTMGGAGVVGAAVSMLVDGPEDGVAFTVHPGAAQQKSRLALAARAVADRLARMSALRPARSRRRPSRE